MRQIRETNLEPRLEEPGLDHRLLELLRMNPDLDIPHFLATRAAAVFSRPAWSSKRGLSSTELTQRLQFLVIWCVSDHALKENTAKQESTFPCIKPTRLRQKSLKVGSVWRSTFSLLWIVMLWKASPHNWRAVSDALTRKGSFPAEATRASSLASPLLFSPPFTFFSLSTMDGSSFGTFKSKELLPKEGGRSRATSLVIRFNYIKKGRFLRSIVRTILRPASASVPIEAVSALPTNRTLSTTCARTNTWARATLTTVPASTSTLQVPFGISPTFLRPRITAKATTIFGPPRVRIRTRRTWRRRRWTNWRWRRHVVALKAKKGLERRKHWWPEVTSFFCFYFSYFEKCEYKVNSIINPGSFQAHSPNRIRRDLSDFFFI